MEFHFMMSIWTLLLMCCVSFHFSFSKTPVHWPWDSGGGWRVKNREESSKQGLIPIPLQSRRLCTNQQEGRHSTKLTDRYMNSIPQALKSPPSHGLLPSLPLFQPFAPFRPLRVLAPPTTRTLHPPSHAPTPSQQSQKHWRTPVQWTLVTNA